MAMIEDRETNLPSGLLNDPKGILGAASARADMCFCLGLIDRTAWENAKRIARIRNLFAHSHAPVAFNDAAVEQECKGLFLWLVNSNTGHPLNVAAMKRIVDVPRYHFVLTACVTFLDIMHAAYNEPFENEQGEVAYRQRKHSVARTGRFLPQTDGKSIFNTVVLFND
jgi:hypothetical protein